MKREDLQKVIDEQLPGFEIVETRSAERDERKALRTERPADALKRRTATTRAKTEADGGRESPPAASASGARAARDQFFADPDPRVRLRRRGLSADDGCEPDEQTVVVKVRPVGRVQDSTNPSAGTKSILIRGKRIVGYQG